MAQTGFIEYHFTPDAGTINDPKFDNSNADDFRPFNGASSTNLTFSNETLTRNSPSPGLIRYSIQIDYDDNTRTVDDGFAFTQNLLNPSYPPTLSDLSLDEFNSIVITNYDNAPLIGSLGYQFYEFNGQITSPNPPNLDVSNFSLNNCFEDATDFNSDISNWNVSSVIDMFRMFRGATIYNNGGVSLNSWDTSNVGSMFDMFRDTTNFNVPIDQWDVSNVIDFSGMFSYSDSLPDDVFNQPIGSWNTSSAIFMNSMFNGRRVFNQNLNSWDVSNVQDMFAMFANTVTFNQPLNNWNTSSLIRMRGMFADSISFNQDISSWNVSNVENMATVFDSAEAFNQDLSTWDTSNVQTMRFMFQKARSIDPSTFLGNWNFSGLNSDSTDTFSFGGPFFFRQPMGNIVADCTQLSASSYSRLLQDLANNTTFTGNPFFTDPRLNRRINLGYVSQYRLPDNDTRTAYGILTEQLSIVDAGELSQDFINNVDSSPDKIVMNTINDGQTFTITNTTFIVDDGDITRPTTDLISSTINLNLPINSSISGNIQIPNSNDSNGNSIFTSDFLRIVEIDGANNENELLTEGNINNNFNTTISQSRLRIEFTNNESDFDLNGAGFVFVITPPQSNPESDATVTQSQLGTIQNGDANNGSSNGKVKIVQSNNQILMLSQNNTPDPDQPQFRTIEVYDITNSVVGTPLFSLTNIIPVDAEFNAIIDNNILHLLIETGDTTSPATYQTIDLSTNTVVSSGLITTTPTLSTINDIKFLFNGSSYEIIIGDDTTYYTTGQNLLSNLPIGTGNNFNLGINPLSNSIVPTRNSRLQSDDDTLFFSDLTGLYEYNSNSQSLDLLTNIGFVPVTNINSIKRINNGESNTEFYVVVYDNQNVGLARVNSLNNNYEIISGTNQVVFEEPITQLSQITEDYLTVENSFTLDSNLRGLALVPTNSVGDSGATGLALYEVVYSESNIPIGLARVTDINISGSIGNFSQLIGIDKIPTNIRNGNEYIAGLKVSPNGGTDIELRVVSFSGELACFLAGTKILTTSGYVNIEDLSMDDKLISGDGRVIGIKSLSTTSTLDNSLCKIPVGTFGCDLDTYISKHHAIFDRNSMRFVRPMDLPEYGELRVRDYGRIEYYHIELFDKTIDTFIANGMIVEGNNQKGINSYKVRNKNRSFLRSLI